MNLNGLDQGGELKYHTVFTHSFDAVLLLTPDGRILAANPAACRMFGRSEEEICRLGCKDIMNIDDPRLARAIQQSELTGRFEGELTGVRSDSTIFPIELTTSVFTDTSGEKRFSLIIRDITIRNRYRDELRAKEASMRSIIENTENSIWSVDRDFRLLAANSAFQAWYNGMTGHSITPGDNVLELMPDDLKEMWRKYLGRGLSGVSFTTMSSSGAGQEIRYIRFSFNPVRNITGEVTGLAVMGTDITDLMLMQTGLIRTGVLLREAQSVARIGNWEYDVKLARPDWSDEVLRIFGLPKLAGKTSWDAQLQRLSPDDLPRFKEGVIKAFSEGIPFTMAFRLQLPGEEVKWINVICETEKDSQGNVTRLYGTVQDLTERKMYEEGLRKSGETLRKLNIHIEEAREKERSQIAMNLHDDLGQKLTALKMNLSWLRKRIGVQSAIVSDKLHEVEDIIDNSVSTVQRISSELRPAILYDLGLKEAVEWLMRQNLEPAGIKGSFSLDPEGLVIEEKSSIILFRIIQEGLTNIIRHSGAANADITITGLPASLELVIMDNGRGINPETASDPRSFGLSGIRERVNNLSGEFSITGRKGKGTVLKVKIPYTNTEQKDDQGNNYG